VQVLRGLATRHLQVLFLGVAVVELSVLRGGSAFSHGSVTMRQCHVDVPQFRGLLIRYKFWLLLILDTPIHLPLGDTKVVSVCK
jgi:hypothetical protein